MDRFALDLPDQPAVRHWSDHFRPDAIELAAAGFGGVTANATYPARLPLVNLLIETAVVGSAHSTGVDRLLFLGSSCVCPKYASQYEPR